VVGAGIGGSSFARYLKMWRPSSEISRSEPLPDRVS